MRTLGKGNYGKCVRTLLTIGIVLFASITTANAQFSSSFIENSDGCSWPWSAVSYHPTTNVLYGFYEKNSTYKLVKWNANGTSRTLLGSFTAVNASSGTGSGSGWAASDDVDLAIGTNGHIHVVFRLGGTGSCCNQPRGVFYAKSTDNGSTWAYAKIETYSDPSGWKNTDDPLIRLDGSNNPHIAFMFRDANSPRRYSVRYTKFNGTSWDAVENAHTQTGASNEVDELGFDLDSNGKPHISFQRETNGTGCDGGLWYTNKTGASWSGPTELQAGSGNCSARVTYGHNSNLQVDPSNKVHIVSSNYQDEIFHSTNAGGS